MVGGKKERGRDRSCAPESGLPTFAGRPFSHRSVRAGGRDLSHSSLGKVGGVPGIALGAAVLVLGAGRRGTSRLRKAKIQPSLLGRNWSRICQSPIGTVV
jgi:hypothetical protein